MVFEREFQRYGINNIVAYSASDITDAMIDDAFKLDESFYKKEYSIENSQIREIVKEFGQICFCLYDKKTKKMMGYSYWIPIKTSVFVDFIKKDEMLLNLNKEHCSNFNEATVNLFSAGEAFFPGYDLDAIHKALEDIFQGKILVLAQRGVKVEYVAVEAVCAYDKEYLVKQLGLKRGTKKPNSQFFCDKYSPKTTYSRSIYKDELLQYYK